MLKRNYGIYVNLNVLMTRVADPDSGLKLADMHFSNFYCNVFSVNLFYEFRERKLSGCIFQGGFKFGLIRRIGSDYVTHSVFLKAWIRFW